LGYALAVAGKRDEALKIVRRLDELSKQRYVSPYHTAVVYAGLGEKERALDLLEKARNERFNWMPFLQVEPLFDALRGEPKFNELAGSVDPAR
jgi:serine/threonine-protein kinase